MRPPEDDALLRDMVAHARLAVAAISGKTREDLDLDPVLAAALERFIEVVGEAANKISTSTKDEASEIAWREIVGMRNRLVHGYASVDHDIVWDVVTGDLGEIIRAIESVLGD